MNNLLHSPSGVRDIIGSECVRKKKLTDTMLDTIISYGYQPIDTPVFEYLDCFAGAGSLPIEELYKFTDKEGHLLALRPDFTPSIARVSAKYFLEKGELIKLCYTGNVYRNQDSFSGKSVERTQLGVEFIGDDTLEADIETISLLVSSLKKANPGKFKISIGHKDIITGLCNACSLDTDKINIILSFIKNKNFFGLQEYLEKWNIPEDMINIFIGCMNLYRNPDNLDILTDKIKNTNMTKVLSAINYLQKLMSGIELYSVGEYVSLDLSIINDYEYYTGIIFYAYTYGSGNAIGSGGRYDKLLAEFGKNAPAIGFAIYIDDLIASMPKEYDDIPCTAILYNNSYPQAVAAAEELRNKGKSALLIKYKNLFELNNYKQKYNNHKLIVLGEDNV